MLLVACVFLLLLLVLVALAFPGARKKRGARKQVEPEGRLLAEAGMQKDQKVTDFLRDLMVAEVTEMFMLAQGKGWFAPDGSNANGCENHMENVWRVRPTNAMPRFARPESAHACEAGWLNA